MRRFSIQVRPIEPDDDAAMIRRQFVVRDEQEFITSFDPIDGATLESVVSDLTRDFHAPDGDGYDGTDMVVWRAGRIVALVRKGDDGEPQAVVFETELD